MSINNMILVLLLSAMVGIPSCTKGPVDSDSLRLSLGDISVGISTSLPNRADIQFRGRVESYDTQDSIHTAPGLGYFKHFVSLTDTLTGDTLRILYTLPRNASFRVDASLRAVVVYKEIQSRFALILRSKSDSLVAMVNTLHPEELDTIITKTGAQHFRVGIGPEMFASRATACGREGDFNMVFSFDGVPTKVSPASTAEVRNGDRVYGATNITNTQPIKDLGTCPNFDSIFAFMIIRQQ